MGNYPVVTTYQDRNNEIKNSNAGVKRVLMIEDEPAILRFLSQILACEGPKVEAVTNADDALNRLQNEEYDLILVDIKIPSTSGIELYEHTQKIALALANRIVFTTADVMGEDTKDFLLGTKASYITKPFQDTDLRLTVKIAIFWSGSS